MCRKVSWRLCGLLDACWSIIVSKFSNVLGSWVKRCWICAFCFFEILVCLGAADIFLEVPKLSEHSPIAGGSLPLFMMILRSIFAMGGLIGTCRRSIRATRLYFTGLPVGMFFCALVCLPLLTVRCSCNNDFVQCDILTGFGEIVNVWPPPEHMAEIPKKVESKGESISRRLNLSKQLPGEQEKLPQSWHRVPSHTQGFLGNRSSQPAGQIKTVEKKSPLLSAESRRLTSRKNRERSRPEAEREVQNWLSDKCTCDGDVFRGQRESCKAFVDSETGNMEHWCKIRPSSELTCRTVDEIVPDIALEGGFLFTSHLCTIKAGCACSEIGMPPGNDDVKPGLVYGEYGNGCDFWRHGDKAKWCFVGFDTTCPDREVHRNIPIDPEENDILQVSQFSSRIPCQEPALNSAYKTCMLVVILLMLMLTFLNIVTLPMFVIVWLFLLNRCGDNFETSIQFEVELSDESSQDDFDVDAPDAELEQLPMEMRRSQLIRITGNEAYGLKDAKKKKKKHKDKSEKKEKKEKKEKSQNKEKKEKKEKKEGHHGKKEKKHKKSKNDDETEIELRRW